jgi:hypothetical protein
MLVARKRKNFVYRRELSYLLKDVNRNIREIDVELKKLIDRVFNQFNFRGYQRFPMLKETMRYSAICQCYDAILKNKIDTDKKPFSYLYETIYNAFLQEIKKSDKHNQYVEYIKFFIRDVKLYNHSTNHSDIFFYHYGAKRTRDRIKHQIFFEFSN